MGNSFTCPCSETTKGGVLVLKSDGSLLLFKRGIHAKEVSAANPGYRVVRCDSDRTVLWGSAELESHRLYFLMPETKARCRATFDKFRKVGEGKGLVPPRSKGSTNGDKELGSFARLSEVRKLAWTPQLRTIPEIVSPSAAPPFMVMEMTSCSLEEQLEFGSPVPRTMMVM